MGVKIKRKDDGYWIFICHRGRRKAKKIGKDKKLARKVGTKIEARLALGDLNLEKLNSKTYATIRLMKGQNIGDVSYQLGHSDISITYKVYVHWIPGKFKSEVDELDTQVSATQAQAGGMLAENM